MSAYIIRRHAATDLAIVLTQQRTTHAHVFSNVARINGLGNGDRHGCKCQQSESNSNRSRSRGTSYCRSDRGPRYTFLSIYKIAVTIRINEYLNFLSKRTVETLTGASGHGHCLQTAHLESGASAVSLETLGQPSKLRDTGRTAIHRMPVSPRRPISQSRWSTRCGSSQITGQSASANGTFIYDGYNII